MFLFSHFNRSVVKDAPPDKWDEEEQQEELKEKPRSNDRDLEYLIQKLVKDSSLDEFLIRDLQSKKLDPKYKEMLVSIIISIRFNIYSGKR